MGFKLGRTDLDKLFKEIDIGNVNDKDFGASDGKISFNEFKHAITTWISNGQKPKEEKPKGEKTSEKVPLMGKGKEETGIKVHDTGEKEELPEEEDEDSFKELTNDEVRFQAILLLLAGTLICTVVSDPMVDVISSVGLKMDISPFYVSFVVTPLASNASEVIAGLIFAKKKTVESISLTLSTLHGAATMNSTLALCIFMSLVYFRNLSWSFSAEVITVLFVIIVVGLNGLRKVIFLWQALIVAFLYPLSIIMVYVMETYIGLD